MKRAAQAFRRFRRGGNAIVPQPPPSWSSRYPVRLYFDNVRRLFDILGKVAETVSIHIPGRDPLTTPGELLGVPNKLRSVRLIASSRMGTGPQRWGSQEVDIVTVELLPERVRVLARISGLDAEAVVALVREELTDRCGHRVLRLSAWLGAAVGAVPGITVSVFYATRRDPDWWFFFAVVPAMFAGWLGGRLLLTRVMKTRAAVVHPRERPEGFWRRRGDDVILLLIGALVMLVGTLVAKLVAA